MSAQLQDLQDEQWLIRRLMDHGAPQLDAGVTTTEERRERIRAEIVERDLTQVIAGSDPKTGKPMLYPKAFTRLYGVPFA